MKTRILQNPDQINALRASWNQLEPDATLPMQHFIWVQACASSFAHEGELRLLMLENNNEPVAMAPLLHRQGKPCLELLGVQELHEPTDILCKDREALRALAAALADLKTPLLLHRIPADSPLPEALSTAFRGRGVLFCRPDSNWPTLPLDSRSVEPESQINAGRRSDFRRAQRIAEKMGPVTYEIITPDPSTLAPLLDEAVAVEAASWKGEIKTAMAHDPVRGAFYRQYAQSACEIGILRLSFLRIGNQTAAMQMAVESSGSFWLLKIGYDQQFARCSPGNLLLRETIRYAAERGLKSLEFLGAVEPWVKVWTQQEKPCVVIRAYPFGVRGAKLFAGDVAKSGWQKLRWVGRIKN